MAAKRPASWAVCQPLRQRAVFPSVAKQPFRTTCQNSNNDNFGFLGANLPFLISRRRNYTTAVEATLVSNQPIIIESRETAILEDGAVVFRHIDVPISIPPPPPRYARLSAEQIEEVRKLKQQDPNKWTQRTLAKTFNANPAFVARIAPAPPERKEVVKEQQQIEELKRVFGDLEARKRTKNTGMKSLAHLNKMNSDKFQNTVKESGGLKKVMKENNIVPKRKRAHQGKPSRSFVPQGMEIQVTDTSGAESSGLDFKDVTKRSDTRSLTADELERFYRRRREKLFNRSNKEAHTQETVRLAEEIKAKTNKHKLPEERQK